MKRGTSWRTGDEIYSDTTDEGYFQHWRPIAENLAAKMLRSSGLPECCRDDFVSDALLALARVPQAARWNAKYVRKAIELALITQWRRARTRWERFEMWAQLPEAHAVAETLDGMMLRQFVKPLVGREKRVTELYLLGHGFVEIGRRIGRTPKEAQEIFGKAVARMQEAARRIN